MPAGYDSWLEDVERGDGYAIGGTGARQTVRTRPKWRAELLHLARLVAVDLTILVACAGSVGLLMLLRDVVALVVAAVAVTATGLWFRHQRLEHDRRPR